MLHVKGKGHPGGLQGGAVGGRQSKALATSGLKHQGKPHHKFSSRRGVQQCHRGWEAVSLPFVVWAYRANTAGVRLCSLDSTNHPSQLKTEPVADSGLRRFQQNSEQALPSVKGSTDSLQSQQSRSCFVLSLCSASLGSPTRRVR